MQIVNFIKLLIIIFLNSIIEFLPISSTAHNVIFFKFLNLNFVNLNLILVFLQLAVTCVVCLYFSNEILYIIKTFFFEKKTRIFCYKVLLSTVPTVMCGLLLRSVIKNIFYENVFFIAAFLIIGGICMFFIKENGEKCENMFEIDIKTSFIIGLCQSLSLIPGVSRSASTICSALLCKINKKISIKYSFFISIPISFMACFYDLYKNIAIIYDNYQIYLICFIFSFIFPLIFIKKVIIFVENIKLQYFGFYRIIVGIILIITNLL